MRKGNKVVYNDVCGHFLLARLNVKGIFARSVVWVYDFSEKTGARGLILNHPTGRSLARCAPNFAGTALGEIPIFIGGPVEPAAILFVTRTRAVLNGTRAIRVGASPKELRGVISNPGVRVYGFAGRAEWDSGQLENELERKTWIRLPMDAEVWDEGGEEVFWRRLLTKSVHPDAELMLQAPQNPSEN